MRTRRWSGALLAGGLLAGGLLLAAPTRAATQTVTLSAQGPSPSTITIARGDVIRFHNSDNVTHTVKSSGTNWAFSKALAAGASASTASFTSSGTYKYVDSYTLVAIPQSPTGSIVVPAAPPSPPPSPKPSATPRASSSPRASVQPAVTSSPTPSPSTSGTGTAIGPGLGVGGFPVVTPSQTSGPQPNVAPPGATRSAAAGATSPTYAGKSGVVQGSAHGYGLPALLALVGIAGIASLLVRLLLTGTSTGTGRPAVRPEP